MKVEMLELTKGYAYKYRKEAQQSLERNNHMNEIEGGPGGNWLTWQNRQKTLQVTTG